MSRKRGKPESLKITDTTFIPTETLTKHEICIRVSCRISWSKFIWIWMNGWIWCKQLAFENGIHYEWQRRRNRVTFFCFLTILFSLSLNFNPIWSSIKRIVEELPQKWPVVIRKLLLLYLNSLPLITKFISLAPF